MRVVHLPVARHHRLAVAHRSRPFRSACRPGRSPCSMNSSDAPPPVRHVVDAVGEPELAHRRRAVAAADDREAAAVGARPRRPCASRPRTAPSRTHPSGRSTTRSPRRRSRRRSVPAVSARCRSPSSRRGSHRRRTWRVCRVGGHVLRDDDVGRDHDAARLQQLAAARRPGRARRASRRRSPPCATRNVNAIAPPMRIVSQRVEQRVDHAELVADLRAAEDRDERAASASSSNPPEHFDLAGEQPARGRAA